MSSLQESINVKGSSRQPNKLTNFQQEKEQRQGSLQFGKKMKLDTDYVGQDEQPSPQGIRLPGVELEPDYAASEASFLIKDGRKTHTLQMSSHINASEYLKTLRQEDENKEIVRLKNINKNQIFNERAQQDLQLKSSLLAQQNYQAFGQKDAKELIQRFVKRKGSIGYQRKLQIREKMSMPLPSQDEQDRAVKESYKNFRRDGRQIQYFNSIYNQFSVPKEMQMTRFSKGRTQSLNRSNGYKDYSIESASPNPQIGFNDSFKLGVSFYQSGKKTIETEQIQQTELTQEDGFQRSLMNPKVPRESKISPKHNVNILYSALRMQENKSQMRGNKEQQNFIYENSPQQEANSILLLQKHAQNTETSIQKTKNTLRHQSKINQLQENKSQTNIKESVFPIVQKDFRKSALAVSNEKYYTMTPQKSNVQEYTSFHIHRMSEDQKNTRKVQSSLKNSMNEYFDNSDLKQLKRNSFSIAKNNIGQNNNTIFTTNREKSQPVHKRKPSFMSYKVPDLNSCHWYLQNYHELINVEQQRIDRQHFSIEDKLRNLSNQANPKTTSKEHQFTDAEGQYFDYVENKVGQMGNLSKNMIPQKKKQGQILI